MHTILARRYDTGEPVRITISGDRIATVVPATPAGPVQDWPYVAPGLFDPQINGYGGNWFIDSAITPEKFINGLRPYFGFGVTRLFPTLVTASHENLRHGFQTLRQTCEQVPWLDRMVAGCHLEGPYISPVDGPRGAHPLQHIRPADWDEFCRLQEVSGNRIRMVTIAPEIPQAIEFIRRATQAGVVIAIGHTAATTDQIAAAVDAGARTSTHLGNGAHGQIRRHPNYIWDQLAEPRLFASLITDGYHLPRSVVYCMVRVKTPQRILITCDASGFAGSPPGRYRNELGEVDVLPDGRIVVAGQEQILAGSGAGTDICVARLIEYAEVSLREAIDMTSRNPCRLLNCPEAQLRPDSLADLFVFRYPGPPANLEILATLASGELQYGRLPNVN